MILKQIISKWHYSEKNVAGATGFFFCTSHLMLLNICTKFHENILDGIKVLELTRFSLEIFQRVIISQILLVEQQFLCSAHCLILVYFCTQFHENIFDVF